MSMKREEIIKEYENAVVASGLAAAAGNGLKPDCPPSAPSAGSK